MADSGGIVNAKLDPGEEADITIVLRNAGTPVGPLTGRLESNSPHLTILDPNGSFAAVAEGETTSSAGNGFRVRAAITAPVEMPAYCNLVLAGNGYHDTVLIPVLVGDSTNLPAGPDAGGYRIYDYTDSGYARLPVYDWFELRGRGTRLVLGGDETRPVPLPERFGPWRYYGVDYDTISICSNGWVAAGWTDRCDFVNVELPYPNAPPNIVAVQWDDLDPTAFGSIWYFHDTANHRFIVEYDSVPYFGHVRDWEKVQFQLYDQTVTTPTGDNSMMVQFQTANNFTQATVGFQNRDGSIGLTHTCNNWYPRVSAPLAARRALRFETTEFTGVERTGGQPPSPAVPTLTVRPNPTRGSVMVMTPFALRPAPSALRICDSSGRLVLQSPIEPPSLSHSEPSALRLPPHAHRPPLFAIHLSLNALPPGVYFVSALPAAGSPTVRLTVLP